MDFEQFIRQRGKIVSEIENNCKQKEKIISITEYPLLLFFGAYIFLEFIIFCVIKYYSK